MRKLDVEKALQQNLLVSTSLRMALALGASREMLQRRLWPDVIQANGSGGLQLHCSGSQA